MIVGWFCVGWIVWFDFFFGVCYCVDGGFGGLYVFDVVYLVFVDVGVFVV